jgi:glycosyltransferase involved in cell wall biosynthesis
MILYLGNKLSNHGFTPTFVETLGTRLSQKGMEITTKSSIRNEFVRLVDMLWNIIKLRHRKPVVLIDTYSTNAFYFAWCSGLLCRILKLNYIPILHGGNLPIRIKQSPRTAKLLFENSFTNIAVSLYMQYHFEKYNFPVLTIHNYIDLNEYPFKQRCKIKPRLLWVRSFHNIYNPQMAINVLHGLIKEYPDATLCMVGPDKDGSLELCKNIAKAFNLPVEFKGKLSKKEWITLSENFDIFINTTNVDNTPVSVMEAMALGMPVITTDAGGIPFLFENHKEGIIVPAGNVVAMKTAISELLQNESLTTNISFAARAKAMQWDWEIIGEKWFELLTTAQR